MDLLCTKYKDLLLFKGWKYYFSIKQCPLKLMSCEKWLSTKVGAILLSDLVIFSIISSNIPLDFYNLIRVVPVKYLMYFLAGTNTN